MAWHGRSTAPAAPIRKRASEVVPGSGGRESRARSGAAVRGVQARLHPHQPSSEIQWSAACSLLRNMPRMGLAAPIKNIVYLERSRPIACPGEAAKKNGRETWRDRVGK